MKEGYIILGDFEGSFFTLQGSALGASDAYPLNDLHKVRIYKGQIRNTVFEASYDPDQYRLLSSIRPFSAQNILLEAPEKGIPFKGARIYNFEEFILIDPQISSLYDSNGKTYGQVKSRVYGKTRPFPVVSRIDPDGPLGLPDLVDETYTGNTGIQTGGGTGDNGGTGGTSGGNDGGQDLQGCLHKGCLGNFWSLLMLIFFLLMLVSLFRSCQFDEDQCVKKELALSKLAELQRKKDSIAQVYERNLTISLRQVSKIYFYQNSSNFEVSSKNNIQKLYNIISNYNDRQYLIEGHHCGAICENSDSLDVARARKIRDTLVQLGIKPHLLDVVVKGDQELLNINHKMSESLENNIIRKFSTNMRVEVKTQKP